MDIMDKKSQLVIFSASTTFINSIFLKKVLQVFSSNSCRSSENKNWHWTFAFDLCVGVGKK